MGQLGLVVSSIKIRSKLVMGEKGVGGRIAQVCCWVDLPGRKEA